MQMAVLTKTEQFVPRILLICTFDATFQYVRLPPATTPYILRVSIEAGTPASKNGIFKTNFPLDGGVFARDRFAERKSVFSRVFCAEYLMLM